MKLKQRIIAILMIIMLMGTNLLALGKQVVAANLTYQDNQTNHKNVEFNSYFEGETYFKELEIGKTANLYFVIKVNENGYLKNTIVNISHPNFQIDVANLQDSNIQRPTETQIRFNQINANQEIIIEVPIQISKLQAIEPNFLQKASKIEFTATYIDGEGKERAIEKTIENQAIWKAQAELELTAEVSKYIPYQTENENGVLLQLIVNSNIKDQILPVSQTNIQLQVPQINGNHPQRVNVFANQITSTGNDESGIEFQTENYQYDNQTGNLIIQTSNLSEDGMIAWNQNGKDEYVINLIYVGQDIYQQVIQNGMNGTILMNGSATIPDNENTTLEKQITIEYDCKETKGTITDVSISTQEEISKGYVYANFDKISKQNAGEVIEEKIETVYEVNYRIQINDVQNMNQIELQTAEEKYVTQDGKEYDIGANSFIKQMKISEVIFEQLLGEQGNIVVKDAQETIIGNINTQTSKDENNNYILDISETKVNKVILEITKPITQGNLDIKLENALSTEQTYTKDQMKQFSKITLGVINLSDPTLPEKRAEITLAEPVSKAEISIANENLSTIVENENVEIRVVLDTSSTQYALYQNPTIEIEFPSQVEKVEIKDINLLLEDELEIKESKVITRNNKKVIQITLNGTQTKYMEEATQTNNQTVIAKGANIILNTNITLNKLAPSGTEDLVMYYTNQATNLYENANDNDTNVNTLSVSNARMNNINAKVSTVSNATMGIATANFNLVAPSGVATVNSIKGYDTANSTLTSNNSEKQEATIDAYGETKQVTIEGIVTNNYSNTLENMMILGGIPFSGNKVIDEDTNLESNFTMPMNSKITTSGIDSSRIRIYYSTNGEATKDLLGANNGWTENPTQLSDIRSYLIVISGEVVASSQLTFSYTATLPENLEYGNSSYQMYKVYYDNQTSSATIGETKVSGIVGLTTGESANIEVTLTSNMEQNSNVTENQIVRFFVNVKNTGEAEAENVTINIPVPDGTAYTQYDSSYQTYTDSTEKNVTIALGNLKAGEETTATYELKMQEGDLGTIEHQVRITTSEVKNGVPSNTYTLNKIDGKMILTVAVARDQNTALHKGDILYSTILIENQEEELHNVVITIPIPQGITITEATYRDKNLESKDYIKIENNQVIATIPTLEVDTLESIKLTLEIEDLKGNFEYIVSGVADNMDTHYSNELIYYVGSPAFTITQTSSSERYVKEAQQVTYEFNIQNKGNSNANEVVFENQLPEGLTFVRLEYTYQGQTEVITSTLNNTATVRWTSFEQGAQATVKVIAQADLLPDDKQDKTITNKATIVAQGINQIESNAITNIIEYNESLYQGEEGNEGTNPSERYKITGIAWIDDNQNGQREETEELLSGIQVVLIQKSNNEIVTDVDNAQEKITTTNQDGTYEFNNLVQGEYLVIFLYDAGKYSVTEYQEQGVSTSYNSDAISMRITLNGEQQYAGVTNTIKVNNNVRDIDIGLYIAEKFDLRLDKYISKITLTTPTIGTTVYEYGNSKLEKIEVLEQNINKSSIVAEYKIVVTNEGQVPGYAKKIIDYMPQDARFNSELNQDWYIATQEQVLYNTSLENTIINPGESKEVTLVLTYNITDNNISTIVNNNAEIYESYNEQGIADIDSTEANKVESEDDMSNADIVLGVVTGRIVIYSTLILTIIFMIVIGVFMIQRNILTTKKKNNGSFLRTENEEKTSIFHIKRNHKEKDQKTNLKKHDKKKKE